MSSLLNDRMSVSPFRLVVLATGGTLEKRYDAHVGELTLEHSMIETIIGTLEQPDIEVHIERVMAIDSLEMGAPERQTLGDQMAAVLDNDVAHAVLITHGTDTLPDTARALAKRFPELDRPVLLTGAMVPFATADSDGLQNVAQAVMAARLLPPGVYGVLHSRVIAATQIAKDYDRLTMIAQ